MIFLGFLRWVWCIYNWSRMFVNNAHLILSGLEWQLHTVNLWKKKHFKWFSRPGWLTFNSLQAVECRAQKLSVRTITLWNLCWVNGFMYFLTRNNVSQTRWKYTSMYIMKYYMLYYHAILLDLSIHQSGKD